SLHGLGRRTPMALPARRVTQEGTGTGVPMLPAFRVALITASFVYLVPTLRGDVITNRASGKALDAHAGDADKDGCRVQLWQYKGEPQQLWTIAKLRHGAETAAGRGAPADAKALFDKYLIDWPIVPDARAGWWENRIVQNLLLDHLKSSKLDFEL